MGYIACVNCNTPALGVPGWQGGGDRRFPLTSAEKALEI